MSAELTSQTEVYVSDMSGQDKPRPFPRQSIGLSSTLSLHLWAGIAQSV